MPTGPHPYRIATCIRVQFLWILRFELLFHDKAGLRDLVGEIEGFSVVLCQRRAAPDGVCML